MAPLRTVPARDASGSSISVPVFRIAKPATLGLALAFTGCIGSPSQRVARPPSVTSAVTGGESNNAPQLDSTPSQRGGGPPAEHNVLPGPAPPPVR